MGEIDINSLVNLLINLWFKYGEVKEKLEWIDNIISSLKGLTWSMHELKKDLFKVA